MIQVTNGVETQKRGSVEAFRHAGLDTHTCTLRGPVTPRENQSAKSADGSLDILSPQRHRGHREERSNRKGRRGTQGEVRSGPVRA
jgi:hypothetical protein